MKYVAVVGAVAVGLCINGVWAQSGSGSAPVNDKSKVTQTQEAVPSTSATAIPTTASEPEIEKYRYEDHGDKLHGVTLLAGGGVEGYTGSLAPVIKPGPSWGVTAAMKPIDILGVEISYSGGTNEVKDQVAAAFPGTGRDILRNGVNAAATVGLSNTRVQPYVLGGAGVSWYSIRNELGGAGFRDVTNGRIPLGAGLRTHLGHFTFDGRLAYNILWGDSFATAVNSEKILFINSISAGTYVATLQVGGTL